MFEIISSFRAGAPAAHKTPDVNFMPLAERYNQLLGRDATAANIAREGYKGNSIIFVCVSRLTGAIVQAPLLAYDHTTLKPLPESPMQLLLNRPNPALTRKEMLKYTMIYIAIGGEAFWHKVRDAYGQVIQLYPYHASQIKAIAKGGWIDRYQYNNGQDPPIDINVDDIIHFRWDSVDFQRPYKAFGPVQALLKEIDIDNQSAEMELALLMNGLVSPFAISPPDDVTLNPGEAAEVKERIQTNYGGRNRGATVVFQNGQWKITRLGYSPKEMGATMLREISETRAPAAFGIPLELTGFLTGIRYSTNARTNRAEAKKVFYEDTICTHWDNFQDVIQLGFNQEVIAGDNKPGERYHIAFDKKQVAALQTSQDVLLERANKRWVSNMVTLDEARLEVGMQPATDGNGKLYYAEMVAKGINKTSITE